MATEADLLIDWTRIASAVAFYETRGYAPIAVPWVVEEPAYYATRPENTVDYATVNGYLVASGEQSFMQLMDERRMPYGRSQCATPCFRREKAFDDLHLPHFFKVELIDNLGDRDDEGIENRLKDTISNAITFFKKCIKIRVEKIGDTFDIVSEQRGIELGSYGVRRRNGHAWIYGTGLAEPRLTQAIAAERG